MEDLLFEQIKNKLERKIMVKLYNNSGALESLFFELQRHGIGQFTNLESILLFRRNFEAVNNNFRTRTINELSITRKNLETELTKLTAEYAIRPFEQLRVQIDSCRANLNYLNENFAQIVENRVEQFIKKRAYIKSILDKLEHLIIGSIGEEKAISELKKLPDSYYLINNFEMEFSPPLYNSSEDDRIHSIQVDHLVIGPSGVFIIETKYWSKDSIENYNLFSPVKQIRRANFALFVILNEAAKNSSIQISKHHWGAKKIPVRNILLMIGNEPKEEFQFVKILTIDKIIRYITYFKPLFTNEELGSIFRLLVA